MRVIGTVLIIICSTSVFSQTSRYEEYILNKINAHRHRLKLDSLIFKEGDRMHQANIEYCESSIYANDSIEQQELDIEFDRDPSLAPYCTALTMGVDASYEMQFRDSKDITEFDLSPDYLFSNRDFKDLYNQFISDSLFLKTVNAGEPFGTNTKIRRISVAASYKIDGFKIIKVGRFNNKYWLALSFMSNIILYIK